MKKLFRLHFTTIAVIDLLLFAFFSKKPETSLEWLLLSGFIFLLAQGLLLFRLVIQLKHQFVLLSFVSSQRFPSLMPIITACHSTFYYMTAGHLRENYPDFYDKHISLWECL